MVKASLRSFWTFFRILFPVIGGLVVMVQVICLVDGSFRDVDWQLLLLLEAGAVAVAALLSMVLAILVHFRVARFIRKRQVRF